MLVMTKPATNKPGRKKNPHSKRSQGIERHVKPRKAFHADPELFEALDRYCRSFEHKVDESDALRAALRDFLTVKGFWPLS